MCKCWLCGPVSHNEAEFDVSFGSLDRLLRVCKHCQEDLELMGFRANQVVRLFSGKHVRRIPISLIVLGPVYTLLEAGA